MTKANSLLLALILLMLLIIASCSVQPSTPFTNPQGTTYPPPPIIDAAQVKLGKQVYQATCAVCHGANAEGAPNWQTPDAQGNFLSPPHDDNGHTWHHSDRVLYEMIRDGMRDPLRPNSAFRMPAFGNRLSDPETRSVIAYFKSLWSPEHREYQWEQTVDDFLPTPTPPP
ncbi:MAG: cytochrome c [Anaerolineae bacterium]|nr:cytochrome c [Anaerolineae bacterium]